MKTKGPTARSIFSRVQNIAEKRAGYILTGILRDNRLREDLIDMQSLKPGQRIRVCHLKIFYITIKLINGQIHS